MTLKIKTNLIQYLNQLIILKRKSSCKLNNKKKKEKIISSMIKTKLMNRTLEKINKFKFKKNHQEL